MLGAMVAHSILQRSPGFKCIHPALVEYMITKKANTEQLNEDMLPVKGDIARDASTQDVLELIEAV